MCDTTGLNTSVLGTILSLSYDAEHHSLTENWLRLWATPRRNLDALPSTLADPLIPVDSVERTSTYVAGSSGYEFIVCTAEHHHPFAILQRPQDYVHVHRLDSHDGHLIDDLKLESVTSKQIFLCGTTSTLTDPTTGREFFAIGLQSGLIFIINADQFQVHAKINGKAYFDRTDRKSVV